jgi:hypothetical protein
MQDMALKEIGQLAMCIGTYWRIEHALPLAPTLLDMTLQLARIERFQKLKAAKQLL